MARALINIPQKAKRGEIIEIKTLAGHPMENGFRRTQLGQLIPRDIITQLTCTYNGTEVFRADLHPAIAANPLIAFTTIPTESGTLEFRWVGDNGFTATDFVQRLNFQRGLQGELQRTIESLSAVERARVHIVMPEKSLFVKDQRPATASVVLKLRQIGRAHV